MKLKDRGLIGTDVSIEKFSSGSEGMDVQNEIEGEKTIVKARGMLEQLLTKGNGDDVVPSSFSRPRRVLRVCHHHVIFYLPAESRATR